MADESPTAAVFPAGSGAPTRGLPSMPARDVDASSEALPSIEQGTILGRYAVLGELGRGGMGVVVRAYDSKLRREVALKRLRVDRASAESRARLLREAQAMAQLAHPNVVAVFDVEDLGSELVLAMEYVDGITLREWLAERERGVDEALVVLRQAGEGLHAAHRAGLVHRDFKPANVLVGRDGRVRVGDFGIARGSEGRISEPKAGSPLESSDDSLSNPLTREGTIVGTPPYMSPEQHRGGSADARSDQFAFGVTMWEALWRERPYPGRGEEQLQAKRRGPPRPPKSRVPAYVTDVVRRALAPAPGDRFVDMAELLAALDRGRARARRRRLLVRAGIVAAGVLALVGVGRLDRARHIAACEAEGDATAEVWPGIDGAAAARVRAGLVAIDRNSGEAAVANVFPWLDRYAADLANARADACVRFEGRDDLPARARECFDERAAVLATLVEQLASADRALLFESVSAAAGLPDATACADDVALARRPSSTPELRAETAAVHEALSRADALDLAGRYDAGLREAEHALAQAESLQLPWLAAEARAKIGALSEHDGDFERAERELVAAYLEAAKAGATDTALGAATGLVFTVGYRRVRHTEGLLWGDLADVELARLGETGSLRAATKVSHVGVVHHMSGSYPLALEAFERALAIREQALGTEHPLTAISIMNLASTRYAMGEYAEARALYERALAIRERTMGLDHPDVAQLLMNLGAVLTMTGVYDEARALFERTLAIQEGSLDPDHPDIATTLSNLASVHEMTGDFDSARRLLERSIAIAEKAHGPEHPDVATGLSNLGNVYIESKQWEQARALYERAIRIYEKALGPDHPDVAISLGNLAQVEKNVGEYARAREHLERALAIHERALGPDHPDVAANLVGLGEIALLDGRSEQACDLLARALRIREAAVVPAVELANARFQLARALRAAGRDEARARALATAARDGLRETGGRRVDTEQIDAFLRASG